MFFRSCVSNRLRLLERNPACWTTRLLDRDPRDCDIHPSPSAAPKPLFPMYSQASPPVRDWPARFVPPESFLEFRKGRFPQRSENSLPNVEAHPPWLSS